MKKGKQIEIIQQALGEVTALFMSQEVKGTEIVMPTEELIRIANKTVAELNEEVCEKNCPDYQGMEILHKKECKCSCHINEQHNAR